MRMRGMKNAYRSLFGKSEGKRPLVRHRRRWEDGITVDIKGESLKCVVWFDVAQDRDWW